MEGKLQIISGRYKGKRLKIPPNARPTQQKARGAVFNMLVGVFGVGAGVGVGGAACVSTNRFDASNCSPILKQRHPTPAPTPTTVWDAFAGSGAMGIEFISRFGAKTALFTDADPAAIACIRENTKNITDCEIIIENGQLTIDNDGKWKINNGATKSSIVRSLSIVNCPLLIVFVDPPYSAPELGEKLAGALAESAPAGTLVVWEKDDGKRKMENGTRSEKSDARWEVLKDRVHGRARFLILRKR